jgi:asparagine synthase (glutamine-hydrolysing)
MMAAVGTDKNRGVVELDDYALAFYGHPRWLDQRADQTLSTFGPEFITAFRDRGAQALTLTSGDFALALLNKRDGSGLLAVDPFSMRSLAYSVRGRRILFGSTLDALAVLADHRFELDPQSIYNYIYFHVVPGPQTIYRESRRIAPGHYVQFDSRGSIEEQAFSRISFVEGEQEPLADLKARFVGLLESATAACARGARCGTFLSGGTDSSTVTGMLGRVTDHPVDTFSIGFSAEGYDEMEYARLAAGHFGAKHHEYYVTPADVVDAIPRIVASYDEPFGNASAVPTYYCARLAREHAMERLLAGDGGDELFGGNARYAKQQIFAYYERLPSALRAAVIEPALLGHAATGRIPLVRKLRRYVEQATVPMPERYESSNHVNFIGAEAIFERDFLDAVDPDRPRTLMREAHAPFAACSLVNQMLGIDFRFVLADGDLPKVTRMCDLAGVDVAFPMLDANLVAFSTRLAPELKLRGTQLRWFFKQALRDFLPAETIAKKKHGFGLPTGVWLATQRPLFDLAQASLGRLRQRGIVRPDFLNDLGTRLLHEHPGYYGVLMWVLMMLSLWLDSRRP